MKRCHSCGTPWEGKDRPLFKATCDSCHAWLHSCKNCRLHDPTAHNQCLSSTTEPVSDREWQNYCDEFDFKDSSGGGAEAGEADKAKKAWDDLFKKPETDG